MEDLVAVQIDKKPEKPKKARGGTSKAGAAKPKAASTKGSNKSLQPTRKDALYFFLAMQCSETKLKPDHDKMAEIMGLASGESVRSRLYQIHEKLREGWENGLFHNDIGTSATKSKKRATSGGDDDDGDGTSPAVLKVPRKGKTAAERPAGEDSALTQSGAPSGGKKTTAKKAAGMKTAAS